ncbi:type 2 isopentenyl-diphosphate Delta-isomerase [Cytobacillus sp. Hz8]|uniref:type 2 isopentenyl-diphosphate Delta-isomerase n=1 Tax=Cytobacillus sp. Hz8 TaxID=3347168 RepID=UPI0035DE6206
MSRSKRKWEHIQHALSTGQKRLNGFEDIAFVHQSLPDSSVNLVSLNTKIGELSLSSPILINAMTGGGGERTKQINRNLAEVAKVTGVALAVGSQMSGLKDPSEVETYKVIREVNPKGLIFGNLGSEATVEQARKAIEMIEANALQIHLNTIQELTMPEGDRNFIGALTRIEKMIQQIEIPVIVKEVGFGMSRETVQLLQSIGVTAIDIGGFGGTNFAEIENKRREKSLSFFNEWGIPTVVSIIEANEDSHEIDIIGSGGLQSSLDIIKALALGANATGLAGYFLKVLVKEGMESLIKQIEQTHQELMIIMTALGAKSIQELKNIPLVIFGDTHHWLNERGIDTKKFSQRSNIK